MFAFLKMRFRDFILLLAGCGAAYAISIADSGCAQIGSPMGGPRDTIPPVLLKSTPPDSTLHFTGNKIVFTFDEYVQLVNAQQSLLVNPTPKTPPNVDYKLKTVTVKIRDTLQPNTTYRFDFGNSIADNNEGNPYRNFSYVFSTGSYLDSLQFRGKVILAETGKVDSTLLVFLYKNFSDSAVYKEKPRYVTRLDTSGRFVFHNLPGGVYNVFALKDESGQRMYTRDDETFAFLDSTVTVSDTVKPVELFAYNQEPPAQKTRVSAAAPEKKLKYFTSITNSQQDVLSPLTITFNNKLKDFDSSRIRLTDTLDHPFNASISIDSTDKIITVQNQWASSTDYRLIISKDFATDSLGTGLLKSDTVKFKTKKETDYGSLKINFKNLDKYTNPVLQFVSNNKVVNSYPLASDVLSIKLFEPGNYDLRILEDTNKNGIWDPGNYHEKRQPEKVFYIPQKLNIRANWDNEKDLVL